MDNPSQTTKSSLTEDLFSISGLTELATKMRKLLAGNEHEVSFMPVNDILEKEACHMSAIPSRSASEKV